MLDPAQLRDRLAELDCGGYRLIAADALRWLEGLSPQLTAKLIIDRRGDLRLDLAIEDVSPDHREDARRIVDRLYGRARVTCAHCGSRAVSWQESAAGGKRRACRVHAGWEPGQKVTAAITLGGVYLFDASEGIYGKVTSNRSGTLVPVARPGRFADIELPQWDVRQTGYPATIARFELPDDSMVGNRADVSGRPSTTLSHVVEQHSGVLVRRLKSGEAHLLCTPDRAWLIPAGDPRHAIPILQEGWVGEPESLPRQILGAPGTYLLRITESARVGETDDGTTAADHPGWASLLRNFEKEVRGAGGEVHAVRDNPHRWGVLLVRGVAPHDAGQLDQTVRDAWMDLISAVRRTCELCGDDARPRRYPIGVHNYREVRRVLCDSHDASERAAIMEQLTTPVDGVSSRWPVGERVVAIWMNDGVEIHSATASDVALSFKRDTPSPGEGEWAELPPPPALRVTEMLTGALPGFWPGTFTRVPAEVMPGMILEGTGGEQRAVYARYSGVIVSELLAEHDHLVITAGRALLLPGGEVTGTSLLAEGWEEHGAMHPDRNLSTVGAIQIRLDGGLGPVQGVGALLELAPGWGDALESFEDNLALMDPDGYAPRLLSASVHPFDGMVQVRIGGSNERTRFGVHQRIAKLRLRLAYICQICGEPGHRFVRPAHTCRVGRDEGLAAVEVRCADHIPEL